ncbi:MAG: hypothetical protein ACD_35C00187G0011 [uncultured bacterium]|nr:MAG: hypothetical protein ACD_35C00187G0011 [uncultured bacterium]
MGKAISPQNDPDHKSVCTMTLLKIKTKRNNRLNNAWWIDDWTSKLTNKKSMNTSILSKEYPSNIVLKSNTDSIAMMKTKNFLSESLKSSKNTEGTIIIGTTSTDPDPNLHEILLNVQPLGWIYIQEGWKK